MSRILDDLQRLQAALDAATALASRYDPDRIEVEKKSGGSPVTAADRELDDLLRDMLPQNGEGWFSEETTDDHSRLECRRVWIVDPIDGTRDFVNGGKEWSISIGLVEDGRAILGGVAAPRLDTSVVGGPEVGLLRNGQTVSPRTDVKLHGAKVLASRHEINKGDWARFDGEAFAIRPVSSIAWKLALTAIGEADATWTLRPKHEWDVAAGVALAQAVGMSVHYSDGSPPDFNSPDARIPGLLALPDPSHSPEWAPLEQRLLTIHD